MLTSPPVTDLQRQLTILLRGDIGNFVLSFFVLLVGLAALAVHALRRKWGERSLLWFGLFAALYGLRGLSDRSIIHALIEAPPLVWQYIHSVISNIIITPALLFFEQVYGKGWKSTLRWLIWAQAAWGAASIITNFAVRNPWRVPDPSNLLLVTVPVILLVGYFGGYLPPWSFGTGIIFAGGAIFIITVSLDHLRSTRPLFEPFGFMANLACLGYVAIARFVTNEQHLVAIAEEMKSASRIQASILPSGVPRVPGFQIAVRYIPMAAVAGDFYDFLIAGRGGVGVLVADVTGHGVPAALVASMVKVAISAQADHAADPARVISGLNQVMCRQVQGQFTTAGYLYLDVEKRTALYAAAGHPPLLLWRKADQAVRDFRENGLLMGVRAAEQYSNVSFVFEPGDRLLLYTDGVTEASNSADEFFGEDRLKAFLQARQSLSADAFADALLKELAAWPGSRAGGAHTDDITLVVVDVEA